ncbi:Potassium channel GORK [Linum grandiflorum]
MWIRLWRVPKVIEFFHKLEKDIRINYLFTRIIKTAACIFYYLATTLPASNEGYTWIGSLKLGDYNYAQFRDIDIWKRYTTSLYFAIVTMATVGQSFTFPNLPSLLLFHSLTSFISSSFFLLLFSGTGYDDIHAVNLREIYSLFS